MTLSRFVSRKVVLAVSAAIIIVLAVAIRMTLGHYGSDYDLRIFLIPWYTHIQTYGLHGFKDYFANYNLPYLYLLLVAAKLGLPALVGIKLISSVFDFILAGSIFLVVRHFKPRGYIAYFAGLTTLFLPVILLNGSFWGQCDAIFTSFLVLSFWAVLTKRPLLVWVFWGVAFAFKLQAVFFLPPLLFIWFALPHVRIRHIFYPLASLVVFFIPFFPALLAGRSFSSILSIYTDQATTGAPLLTLNAANIYQWVPAGADFSILKNAGLILTAAILVALFVFALFRLRQRPQSGELLLLTTLFLWIAPFFLPTMHERYFFPAEVFTFILGCVSGGRYIVMALIAQLGTCFAYAPFLFNEMPVPLGIVAGVELIIIAILFRDAFFDRTRPTIQFLRD